MFVKKEIMSSFASLSLVGEEELPSLFADVTAGKMQVFEVTGMKPVDLRFEFTVRDSAA